MSDVSIIKANIETTVTALSRALKDLGDIEDGYRKSIDDVEGLLADSSTNIDKELTDKLEVTWKTLDYSRGMLSAIHDQLVNYERYSDRPTNHGRGRRSGHTDPQCASTGWRGSARKFSSS